MKVTLSQSFKMVDPPLGVGTQYHEKGEVLELEPFSAAKLASHGYVENPQAVYEEARSEMDRAMAELGKKVGATVAATPTPAEPPAPSVPKGKAKAKQEALPVD